MNKKIKISNDTLRKWKYIRFRSDIEGKIAQRIRQMEEKGLGSNEMATEIIDFIESYMEQRK